MKVLASLVSFFILSSCNNQSPLKKSIPPIVATKTDSLAQRKDIEKITSEFAITHHHHTIALKDWDKDVNITEILGKPLKEAVRALGEGADTHAGSRIKTLSYKGLTLELYSPQQSSGAFWVLSIEINSPDFKTPRNITIGSSLKQIKSAYPGIEIALNGRTDPNNCAYILSADNNYLRIEVENAVARQIRIYHEIP